MKKKISINAGPRKYWNTDQLIKEAAKDAESAGEGIQPFNQNLYVNTIIRGEL